MGQMLPDLGEEVADKLYEQVGGELVDAHDGLLLWVAGGIYPLSYTDSPLPSQHDFSPALGYKWGTTMEYAELCGHKKTAETAAF